MLAFVFCFFAGGLCDQWLSMLLSDNVEILIAMLPLKFCLEDRALPPNSGAGQPSNP